MNTKHLVLSADPKRVAPAMPVFARFRGFRCLLGVAMASLSLTSHATTLTWDATPATAGPQDGAGTWRSVASNTNWWDGTTNLAWNNATPDSAIFGAGTGAAATVTVSPSGTTNSVGNITFAAPGSGNYTIAGSDSAGTK